jgi:hypothetical protein
MLLAEKDSITKQFVATKTAKEAIEKKMEGLKKKKK